MTPFDPIKAIREELAGLVDVYSAIARRTNQAEQALGLAEVELNSLRKLLGFVRIAIADRRAALDKLEAEQK